jgi:hypothetical protein
LFANFSSSMQGKETRKKSLKVDDFLRIRWIENCN